METLTIDAESASQEDLKAYIGGFSDRLENLIPEPRSEAIVDMDNYGGEGSIGAFIFDTNTALICLEQRYLDIAFEDIDRLSDAAVRLVALKQNTPFSRNSLINLVVGANTALAYKRLGGQTR